MNIAQIENNLQKLVKTFKKESFIYDLLLAYEQPKATIKRIKDGGLNLSKIDGEIAWKKKLLFKAVKGVDLLELIADLTIIKRLNTETLPASLKNKSKKEIEQYIKTKNAERSAIQKNITQLAIKRDAYILAEKTRNNNSNTQPNLQTEIEKIIRSQGKRYNLIIN